MNTPAIFAVVDVQKKPRKSRKRGWRFRDSTPVTRSVTLLNSKVENRKTNEYYIGTSGGLNSFLNSWDAAQAGSWEIARRLLALTDHFGSQLPAELFDDFTPTDHLTQPMITRS